MSLVIDTSITMAWCFQDEATDHTASVIRMVRDQGAIVPSLWPVEVANSVLVGRRRNRLSAGDAATFFALLRNLSIRVDAGTTAHAWTSVFDLAEARNLTAYDACYLDLAIREAIPLATLDNRLRDAARRLGVPLVNPDGSSPT